MQMLASAAEVKRRPGVMTHFLHLSAIRIADDRRFAARFESKALASLLVAYGGLPDAMRSAGGCGGEELACVGKQDGTISRNCHLKGSFAPFSLTSQAPGFAAACQGRLQDQRAIAISFEQTSPMLDFESAEASPTKPRLTGFYQASVGQRERSERRGCPKIRPIDRAQFNVVTNEAVRRINRRRAVRPDLLDRRRNCLHAARHQADRV
jgi:hypothetical protein